MTIINKGIFDTADVFLRQTGNDWPTAQVLSTSDITEGANLYFTNARVTAAVSGNLALKANVSDLTTANVSELTNLYYTNARVYSNVIALLPTLAGSGIAIQANGQISANAVVVTFASISQFLTTSNVSEGSNLYYTNARVNSFIQGNLATKANVTDLTTSNVTELTNLYYTNARVNSFIQGNLATKANVTDLTTSNVSELNNLYYTNARVNSFIQGNLVLKANVADLTTSNVREGSNLYYTNARVNSNVIAFLPSLAGQYINIPANGQINANLTTDSTIVIAANGQIRSNSSGGGVTLVNNTTENSNTFYLLMSNTTVSGTLATVNLANTKLFFNPNTGTLNSTIFNSLSDETVKTNRQRIINALSKISALGGYTYLMIDSNEPSAGLLAQEVQQVLPEAVKFNPNTGLLSLNYNAVLGLVVEAINELEQRVSGLENGG